MDKYQARADAIIRRLPPQATVAELGVFVGTTSTKLLASDPNLSLHMVDKWPHGGETPQHYKDTGDFHSNLSKQKQEEYYRRCRAAVQQYSGAIIVREWTYVAVENYSDEFFDMVFIDADHSYEGAKRDIELWLPKVKTGGYIGGHDYENDEEQFDFGVTKAVDEFIKENSLTLELDDNYTWFARKDNERV